MNAGQLDERRDRPEGRRRGPIASGAARDHREVLALARDACLGDAPGDRVGREADIEAFIRYAVETLAGARR